MSDDPYRSNQPKLFNSSGFCVLLEEIVAAVQYTSSVHVHLKNGGRIDLGWPGEKEKAEIFYKTLSEAVEEYNR